MDVNVGTTISQQSVNSHVKAIAGSAPYQCYLNAQEYLSSNGGGSLPPVTGAGKTENTGDHPTATSVFVATYLDTEIGHELVQQVADERNVTVTPAQQADALVLADEAQITTVMSTVAQTQNPRLTCGASTPLTGEEILQTMPASFVDEQVQFVATASALQEDLAGVGSSEADLLGYYERHRAEFDTVCFVPAAFSTQTEAQTAAAKVAFGTPFSQEATQAQPARPACARCVVVAAQLPSTADLAASPSTPSPRPSPPAGRTTSWSSRRGRPRPSPARSHRWSRPSKVRAPPRPRRRSRPPSAARRSASTRATGCGSRPRRGCARRSRPSPRTC